MSLKGKKTYLVAGGIALAAFARAMGWIDETTLQIILGLLGAGGLATLRAGVTKSGPPLEEFAVPIARGAATLNNSGTSPLPLIDAGPPEAVKTLKQGQD